MGGPVTNGTYVLVSITRYGNCPPAPDSLRSTWVICQDQWQTVQETPVAGGGLNLLRVAATVSFQGAMITATPSCTSPPPTAQPVMWGYDATPGTLVLYVKEAGGVRTDAYARQ
jgi:hypothetical protein